MSSSTSPHVGHHPYFSQDRDSVQKTFRSCDRSRHSCQNFFEKTYKTEGGHRALGSPRAGSVFALVQGHSLLSLKHCRKLVNTAIDKFLNSRTCEQGMQHVFIDVRGSNSYSRIKQAQVLNVQCVGDDPPVLVLDLVSPGSEHFVDDERPLPRW
jgi:hypothetical protein